uniref:ethanolamine ammonia-lyase subunit EutB n=1 Tax=Algoriphagus sp. TaxID=1872435 RepID=UPI0025E56D4E
MVYQHTIGNFNFTFPDLKTVLAKASPEKSGDQMAGLAATNEQERIAAKLVLAEIPLKQFLSEEIIPS